MDFARRQAGILRALERNGFVACQPDHPYLASGPDLLAAREGRLFSLFISKKTERVRDLLGRLAAAKLALADHVAILLRARGHLSASDEASLQHQFDAVLPASRSRDLFNYLDADIHPRATVPPQIKDAAFARADAAEQLLAQGTDGPGRPAQLMESFQGERALALQKGGGALVPAEESSVRSIGRGNRLVLRDGLQVTSTLSRHQSGIVRAAKRGVSDAVEFGYTLDGGVPYPAGGRSRMTVLLVSQFPEMRHDPQRYARAAALVGCLILAARDETEVEEAVSFVAPGLWDA